MIRRTDSIAWICLSHPSCYVPPNLFFPASDHFLFFILPFLYKREPEIFIFISFDIIIFVIEFPYFHAFLFIFTDTTWKERVYKSTFFFTNLWHTAGSRYVNIKQLSDLYTYLQKSALWQIWKSQNSICLRIRIRHVQPFYYIMY